MLLVGSAALKVNFPELERDIQDLDFIAFSEDVNSLREVLQPETVVEKPEIITFRNIKNKNEKFHLPNIEFLLADNSISLKKYLERCQSGVADPEVLFSLKKSHIHFPIKWNKHIADYSFLFNKLNGVDSLKEITDINFKETEQRVGKLKTPSLNKMVKKFFDQSNGYVKSFYVHDDIHMVMSHYDRPVYMDMQVDTSSAWCEKKMWNDFSSEKKSKCILEEAYVIALERKIIPMLNGEGEVYTSDQAFKWAMMRICTTLCSGWFRKFATDNYFSILDYYNPNYVEKFLEAEENGKIIKISNKNVKSEDKVQ